MNKDYLHPVSKRLNPVSSAFIFLLVSLVGFLMIGPTIGSILALPFYEGSFMDLPQKLAYPFDDNSMKLVLYVIQGSATGIGLILVPALYLRSFEKTVLTEFFPNYNLPLLALLISIFIVPAFMFVNSVFIELNQAMELPSILEGMENWMKATEEQAAKLTKYLTEFDTLGMFLLSIFVIAILPAIGEELVFRGVLQRELGAAFKNGHIGIWISAFLFAAIHMQFYGLIPRMLLGALFGYLYFWSGNLIFPIIAHFIQNGSQLFILFLSQKEIIDVNIDEPDDYPVLLIIIFTILTALLLYYFRKIYLDKSLQNHGEMDKGV